MKSKYFTVFFFLFVTVISLSSQNILKVPVDYTTLQDAVDEADPGDIIKIEPGDFYGYTTISKPLTIEGSGKDQTILYYFDETSSSGISPGIINYAKVATPVIKIETTGKVVIKDLEIRGASEGFLHMRSTPFGIISYNAELELINLRLRRLRNIGVWVNRGSLMAVDVDFADNMGYHLQSDLGFHLSNLNKATFIRLNQLQDNIDHTINIHNDKDWSNNRSSIKIEDSTIVASALYWGDCIRSYGGTDITISNSSFYRNAGGEPEENTGVGNTGISFNGNRSSLYISNTSFKNLPRGINLYTSHLGNQFYKLIIEESYFDTFDKSAIYITGQGKADIDLGGGQLGSKGNNIFLPEYSEIVINKESADLNLYLPGQSVENSYSDATENIPEEVKMSGSEIQLLRNGSIIKSTILNGLIPIKAILSGEKILVSYHYPEGAYYLGLFDKNMEFISEYNMGTLEIIDIGSDGDKIISHYKTAEGINYIGTFSNLLEFIGDYWFYSNVTIIKSYFEDGEVRVIYSYENGGKFTGYFSSKMNYLKSVSMD